MSQSMEIFKDVVAVGGAFACVAGAAYLLRIPVNMLLDELDGTGYQKGHHLDSGGITYNPKTGKANSVTPPRRI